MTKTLLPPGCYDLLPPYAGQESALVHGLLNTFEAYGYAQAAPPLLEYTESLLAGRGAALSSQTFRLMDAHAHKVMGLRADITLQLARIAATRLADAPLPLRLSYAGPVLRAHGEKNRGSRQLMQAGIELIGPASPEGDAEVIIIAADALARVGLKHFVIDLNMPGILPQLLAADALDNAGGEALLAAVSHKDVSAVRGMGLEQGELIAALMTAAGPARATLARLEKLSLPPGVREQMQSLARVVDLLETALPRSVSLTVDVTEMRGLEYHTGITFSFFAPGLTAELAAGGRYRIDTGTTHRDATGVTLYVSALRRVLPEPPRARKLFIASPVDCGQLAGWQAEGYITLAALPDFGSSREDAAALGCTHYYSDGKIEAL